MTWSALLLGLGLGLLTGTSWAANSAASAGAKDGKTTGESGKPTYDLQVKPLLEKYCYSCHGNGKHKGDLALDAYPDIGSILKAPKVWETVMHHLTSHEMPPEDKPQPRPAERDLITTWIQTDVFHCDCDHPDPGRVTVRRLNRTEYSNTIRDLVGVPFQAVGDFPADDIGYGFDNIGDVLSMPPILLEKYLAAAERIMDEAIVSGPSTNGPVTRVAAAELKSTAEGGTNATSGRILRNEGSVSMPFQAPEAGEYLLRARAAARQAGPDPARMELRLDGKAQRLFDVLAGERAPKIYETRLQLTPGGKVFDAAFINGFSDPKAANNKRRVLIVESLEVIGPIRPQPLPESHRRIFTRQPTPETRDQCAREIISNFARRAYRRPVTTEEVDRLFRFFDQGCAEGQSFVEAVKQALQVVLVSPNFLFRGELRADPDNPSSVHPVDQYNLATRLSYFLWSTMPDEELFGEAARGTLRQNLERQTRRMLHDPKASALVRNFGDQWLQIRGLALVSPDQKSFPDFDEKLRSDMQKETELFFDYIIKDDRSVLDFLDGGYTFVNERLARHYGLPPVKGEAFQKVSLRGTQRGGILTQGSILTVTSNPTRTSPVKRGKWVLDNLLGEPPPPPPPDVPELKEGKDAELTGSLRQRMEQHRSKPLCASCHSRMDPIGFGLENFDGVGAWRDKEGTYPVDPAGQLVTGEDFKGPRDLEAILVKKKREEFVHCLVGKMLTYALGRGLEFYDKCAVDQISKDLAARRYHFSELVLAVVKSVPFQMERGEGDRFSQATP